MTDHDKRLRQLEARMTNLEDAILHLTKVLAENSTITSRQATPMYLAWDNNHAARHNGQ